MACRLCREYGEKKSPDTHETNFTCSCGQKFTFEDGIWKTIEGTHHWYIPLAKPFQTILFGQEK